MLLGSCLCGAVRLASHESSPSKWRYFGWGCAEDNG